MLVLQGAEEALDDAVGLRGLDAGADVAQQRIVAGERLGKHGTAEAWPVVADHGDGCGHGVQQFAGGLVDQVELAAIGTQILQPEQPFGLPDRVREAGQRVLPAGGWGDGGGEAVLGGVVDDRADPPDPTTARFELAVGSGRGAVSAFRLVRFPGPPAEPDVPVPEHPALREWLPVFRPPWWRREGWSSMGWGSSRPGSGNG